jgi:hypothetical protein
MTKARTHPIPQMTIVGPLADWLIEHRQARILVCDHGPSDVWHPWLLWYEGDSPLPWHMPAALVQRWEAHEELAYEVVLAPREQLDLFQ